LSNKPGNVKLSPQILHNSLQYIQEKYVTEERPLNFVFHVITAFEDLNCVNRN